MKAETEIKVYVPPSKHWIQKDDFKLPLWWKRNLKYRMGTVLNNRMPTQPG